MKMKHIAVVLFALIFACAAAQAEEWQHGYAQSVVGEVNMERAYRGLSALRMDPVLMQAAQQRAREIARKFSHTRPDGTSWRTVSDAAVGENIARGQKVPDKAMAAWMTSDGHRANILRESYGSIGVACLKSGGIYYWVQLFGR